MLKVKDYLKIKTNQQFVVVGRYSEKSVTLHMIDYNNEKDKYEEFNTKLYHEENPIRAVIRLKDNISLFVGDSDIDNKVVIVEFCDDLVHCNVMINFKDMAKIQVNDFNASKALFNEEYLQTIGIPNDIIDKIRGTSNFDTELEF